MIYFEVYILFILIQSKVSKSFRKANIKHYSLCLVPPPPSQRGRSHVDPVHHHRSGGLCSSGAGHRKLPEQWVDFTSVLPLKLASTPGSVNEHLGAPVQLDLRRDGLIELSQSPGWYTGLPSKTSLCCTSPGVRNLYHPNRHFIFISSNIIYQEDTFVDKLWKDFIFTI